MMLARTRLILLIHDLKGTVCSDVATVVGRDVELVPKLVHYTVEIESAMF